MLIPVELVIFIAGLIITGLGTMLSVAVHLLVRIYATVRDIQSTQRLTDFEIKMLKEERATA